MSSAIDPTKPADGVPAVKADLRDNLLAAKLEIEALQVARIPTGGQTSQVLAKASVADFHTQWVDQAGGGETTTASNIGDGVGIFKQKTGSNLEFKTLVAGANMAINLVGDTLELAATASGGSSAHFIDVKNDYGATGNGTTDDHAAIQNAINAAPTKGCVIFFPRGSYRINSALVIPEIASGVFKPVRLQGEGASMTDGAEGGYAGGASTIKYMGSGVCIDIYSGAAPVNTLNPVWQGSIRDMAIHNVGSGTIGIEANALLNAVFQNVLIRGFGKNMKVHGEYFYAVFDGLVSYRGQCDFNHDTTQTGGGPKANGAVFHRCVFSHGPSDGAFKTGQTHWAGAHLKFAHCWFEHIDTVAVALGKANQVIFDQCYFEDKDSGQYLIDYESLGGGVGKLVMNQCYARMTNPGCAIVRVKAGSSSSETSVVLRDFHVASEATGQVAILKNPSWPAGVSVHSENNSWQNNALGLFSGPLTDVTNLYTRNCMFTEQWNGVGTRNAIKPGFTVVP